VLALVTGGSGYFGSLLAGRLLERGHAVRVLDLQDASDRPATVEFVQGDIRDPAAVRDAVAGVDTVFHNVAQVPLARDPALFNEVNVTGTQILLEACADASTTKVVHTSSSAVFGVPASNPVDEHTPPSPAESYGWAKYEAELLCHRAADRGLDVSIVRPRTILGHGRLGIFSIVFDWVADDADVFVLGRGRNTYQFVHAFDLADACIRAGARPGPRTYNIGSAEFGTMREALEGLIAHAGSKSRVRSLPAAPTTLAMQATAAAKLTPFAPYHWIMYGKSLWFDISRAQDELGWQPKYSTDQMFAESYDWFLANRGSGKGASEHRRPVSQGVLSAAKRVFGAGRRP
jgi:nucleoside-diphosphate-sugar epimerase